MTTMIEPMAWHFEAGEWVCHTRFGTYRATWIARSQWVMTTPGGEEVDVATLRLCKVRAGYDYMQRHRAA